MVRKLLPEMIIVTMENVRNQDCEFGIGYTTNYATYAPGRFEEAMRSPVLQTKVRPKDRRYLVEFSGQVDNKKKGYQDRWALLRSTTNFARPVFIVMESANSSLKRRCNIPANVTDRCT